ncbi:MAG: hypothetical protein AAFW89_10090 [Bacteroidota bacterium]
MRIPHLLFILFLLSLGQGKAYAQFVIEPFVASEQTVVETWAFKTIDPNKQFNVFNLNEAAYDHDRETTSLFSYTVFGVDIKKGFGPALGWRFTPGYAAFLGGLQYSIYTKSVLVTLNLTSEFKKNPNIEGYALAQYRFQLSEQLGFFSQLQWSTNVADGNHDFSFQRIRVGLDLAPFQFGLGINQNQFGTNLDNEVFPGLFTRIELY